MPLPEIKLTLRYEDRYLSEKWNDRDADKVVVRTDTHFQKHTISLLISEKLFRLLVTSLPLKKKLPKRVFFHS